MKAFGDNEAMDKGVRYVVGRVGAVRRMLSLGFSLLASPSDVRVDPTCSFFIDLDEDRPVGPRG